MSAELPHTVKVVTLWLLAGLLLFLGIQWWQHGQQQLRFRADGDIVELRRGPDGHYRWPGRINGQAVDFLVDTGASGTAIPASLARSLRLDPLGSVQSNTAGGRVEGQLVRADVALQGGVVARNLRVVALPGLDGNPLLGMDVLGRLHLQQRDGVLRIDLRAAR